MSTKLIFAPDDYDEIYEKYFSELPMWENLDADISYWYNTIPMILNKLNYELSSKDYRSDYSKGMRNEKLKILTGLSYWEQFDINYDEVTLCTSATIASLLILSFLKHMGVSQILFETPCYFASIYQAKILGFETILLATYYKNNYKLNINKNIIKSNKSKAFWLTQPKFTLGINQDTKFIKQLLCNISNKDFVIIDEAVEHLCPTILHSLQPHDIDNLIRFRSLFKPLGLNGPRISCIFHNIKYRKKFQDMMDIMQGGIDYNSIKLAIELYSHPNTLHSLLDIVHNQIIKLRYEAEKICNFTQIELSPIENGYLGSAHIHYNNDKTLEQNRKELLDYCYEIQLPIILGSSMYYAIEPNLEHIRLDYFIHQSLFLKGINKLSNRYNLLL